MAALGLDRSSTDGMISVVLAYNTHNESKKQNIWCDDSAAAHRTGRAEGRERWALCLCTTFGVATVSYTTPATLALWTQL